MGASSTSHPGASSTPQPGTSLAPQPGAFSTSQPGASSTPQSGASSTPQSGASSTPQPPGASSTPPSGASSTPQPGASSTPLLGASSTPQSNASSTHESEISKVNMDDSCISKVCLSDIDKASILIGLNLNNNHVDKFHYLLSDQYEIQSMSLIKKSIQFSKYVGLKVHPRNKPHLQLLHSCSDLCTNCINTHWVCCYYDTKAIFIYDSENKTVLHPSNISFLKQFFHPYFSELPVHFQPVQRRFNVNDSAVLAIAFATSIYFHKSPANVSYQLGKLRPHLYNMFQNNELSLFRTERKKNNNLNILEIPREIYPNKKRLPSRLTIDSNSDSSDTPYIENNLWSVEKDKILKGLW